MRIIAGQFRGRKLLLPESQATRPITDRVKQSLFDIINPRLEGAVVWDVFAGTGSLGLESLSRGAAQAVFFEADRSAVDRLRRNIEALGLGRDRTVVHAVDVFKWSRVAADIPSPGTPGEGQGEGLSPRTQTRTAQISPHSEHADIIFLDPPYRFLVERPQDLRSLSGRFAQNHLRPDGIVVFRHDAGHALELPDLSRYDQRTYGGMMLEFLERTQDGSNDDPES